MSICIEGLSSYRLADSAVFFFFSSRRRHTRLQGDWSSDVCSSDLWIVDPELGRHTGTEALEDDVGAGDELREDRAPGLGFEVQRHVTLVASEERDAGAEGVVRHGNGEDVGAEVAEHHRAERPRQLTRKIEDANV